MQTSPIRPQRTLFLWAFLALLLLAPFIPTLLAQQANLEIQHALQAAAANQWLSAAQHMANAAAAQPGKSMLWEQAGHYALQAGEYQTARLFLERTGMERLSFQGLIDLGDACQELDELTQAIQFWHSALEKGGPIDSIYPRLFRAYRLRTNLAESSSILRSLADQNPQDAQLQYQAGLFLAAYQPTDALDYLNRAARLDINLARRIDRLTQAILQAQQNTPSTLPEAVPVDPLPEISPAYIYLVSGRGLASLNEWLLAMQAFEEAARLQPDYADAWAYLGEARSHITNENPGSQEGLADIQHALSLDPTSLPAHLFLAYYWTRQQLFTQAKLVIEQAQAFHPENPLLLAEMGNIHALSGDLPAANAAYSQAIDLAPGDPVYLRYLIHFSLTYNYQIDTLALPLARQAVILSPNDSESLNLMAQVLIRIGDLANAERFTRRALRLQPDYAPAHLSLGQIFLLNKAFDLARQELDMVLQLAPDSSYADQAQRLLELYLAIH